MGAESLSPVGLGLGLGLQAYNMYDAYQQRKKAQAHLDALNSQPLPEYGVTPEIGNYYNTAVNMGANPRGYSGAERANFRQGIGRTLAGQRFAARNIVGGSSSRALGALDVLPRITAENTFAANDASLARQQQQQALNRQFQGANVYQNARNMNTQAALQRRLMTEQAYGAAVRGQNDYMRNTIGGLGSDLIGAGAMGIANGIGGVGSVDNSDYGDYTIPPSSYAVSTPMQYRLQSTPTFSTRRLIRQ